MLYSKTQPENSENNRSERTRRKNYKHLSVLKTSFNPFNYRNMKMFERIEQKFDRWRYFRGRRHIFKSGGRGGGVHFQDTLREY